MISAIKAFFSMFFYIFTAGGKLAQSVDELADVALLNAKAFKDGELLEIEDKLATIKARQTKRKEKEASQ